MNNLLLVLILLNVPLYYYAWKWVFDDWQDFLHCIKFWFTPDFYSWIRGEYMRDWWAEMKIFLYFVICLGVIGLQYIFIAWVIMKR